MTPQDEFLRGLKTHPRLEENLQALKLQVGQAFSEQKDVEEVAELQREFYLQTARFESAPDIPTRKDAAAMLSKLERSRRWIVLNREYKDSWKASRSKQAAFAGVLLIFKKAAQELQPFVTDLIAKAAMKTLGG